MIDKHYVKDDGSTAILRGDVIIYRGKYGKRTYQPNTKNIKDAPARVKLCKQVLESEGYKERA